MFQSFRHSDNKCKNSAIRRFENDIYYPLAL